MNMPKWLLFDSTDSGIACYTTITGITGTPREGKDHGPRNQTDLNPDSSTYSVISDTLNSISEPQFPHLFRENNHTNVAKLLSGICEMYGCRHVIAHSK